MDEYYYDALDYLEGKCMNDSEELFDPGWDEEDTRNARYAKEMF